MAPNSKYNEVSAPHLPQMEVSAPCHILKILGVSKGWSLHLLWRTNWTLIFFFDTRVTQNGINFYFQLNLTFQVKVNQPPKNRDLNQCVLHLLSQFGGSSLKGWWVITVDSRYLAPFGGQNSRARVKGFSRYFALSREGPNSRLPWIRVPHCDICTSYNQTVCWAIMGVLTVLTFRGSLQTSTSHQQQITTSHIIF